MEDLSLHVLDIAENGIRAGAARIRIDLVEDPETRRLSIAIVDDGSGMAPELVAEALDPFVTTRTERRVGLGIPLFAQSAREAGGGLALESTPGVGTRTEAWFDLGNIDCRPIGDMAETLVTLILGNPEIDFAFTWTKGEDEFELDTAEIREELGGGALQEPAVLSELKRQIADAVRTLQSG